MNDFPEVRDKLSAVAKAVAELKRDVLETQKKHEADLERSDFLWHYLLQSFATMGGASGWNGLIKNRANYSRVKFEAIGDVSPRRRVKYVTDVLLAAKVRYAHRKALYIVACHKRIESLGGPRKAKNELLRQPNRDAKIQFLKEFPGIGEKYARNIMMDVYHKEFRDCIAIDSRMKSLTKAWELSFKSYDDEESFYLSVAQAADIEGWELDRLMFAFQTMFYPPVSC